jgi:trehalose 6-phosphate synthase
MSDCIDQENPADRRIIIASNRGPVTFYHNEEGEVKYRRGSGGLVTALSGMVGGINAAWIATAQTDEDRDWERGRVDLGEPGEGIEVVFLNPDPDVYEQYYNQIANPLLWFLQHSMWDVPRAPVIRMKTWQAWEKGYTAVNRLFADEIAEEARRSPEPTLVMLQDYHLYLAPKMLRYQMRPEERPAILHFIHIPWPGPEYWGILPPTMRQAIIEGLCAVDLLGMQTREDALNFIRTCETYLPGASVSYKRGRIWYRNHATHINDFPISIDVDSLQKLSESPEVAKYRQEIAELVEDRQLILRIDRIEPSKNIIRGFLAFEEMLELYPELHGKVVFLALLVSSRMDVPEYRDYLDDLMAAAGQVNAQYGDHEWEPIRILVGNNYPRAVAALQLYDVLLVNAIADGMNLVAKEGPIVNQRDGVLILSDRAGARQQLESGATVISPCDVYATAEAMQDGLEMDLEERHKLSGRLRWLIEKEDITQWLCKQLDTVDSLGLMSKNDSRKQKEI